METYGSFSPTPFDTKGLGLPDKQAWLIVPVSVTRDSEALETSNWHVALEWLKEGEDEDVEVHRFGHWGPGWFEIVIVKPDSPAAKIAEEIEAALENYPVLNDEDYYQREAEEEEEE